MKRALIYLSLITLTVCGLIWLIGCTKTPSGPGNGGGTPPPVDEYVLEISMDPAIVVSGGGGIVHGSLTLNGAQIDGETVRFRSTASDVSDANMTSSSFTDTSSVSGFYPAVYYHPESYEGTVDTIYAVYYLTYLGDTLAWTSTTVEIYHPVIEIDLSVEPASVPADTGEALIYCFLTEDDIRMDDELIEFRAAGSSASNAIVSPHSAFSDTSATGTVVNVYYRPNDFTGDVDTIFALYADSFGDTIAISSVTVDIEQP